jgi:hypothetical protein
MTNTEPSRRVLQVTAICHLLSYTLPVTSSRLQPTIGKSKQRPKTRASLGTPSPAIPGGEISVRKLCRPGPLDAVSHQRRGRPLAWASEIGCRHPFAPPGLPPGGREVPAREQRGCFAGSNQQSRCQPVLPSSLQPGWQQFDKPAIPPWFTDPTVVLPTSPHRLKLREATSGRLSSKELHLGR